MQADLKPLEFKAIRRLLERLSETPYGADAARALEPAPDLDVARRMQKSVDAARSFIEAESGSGLSALPDIRAALRQASTVGASLSGQALFNLQQVMAACTQLTKNLSEYEAILPGSMAELMPPQSLVDRLHETLAGAGNLRDDANETLAQLFSERNQLRKEAEAVVNKRMQRPDDAGLFKEMKKVGWQNERAVVIVRAADAEHIKGVRRGNTLGGRDVMIEPIEAVSANNRLETIVGRIGTEQQKLFRDLTDKVRTHLDELQAIIAALTWIDLALAAGRLSKAMNAGAPNLTDAVELELNEAIHPLLLVQFLEGTGSRPVPISLRLDQQDRMLVITGPNTGGKTVAIKTIGLFVVMAYCGLHVPAEGPCTIGQYDRLIVDVGDQQDLYHHLSTFAGHVEVLKRVLEESNGHTLVLLDELGTGTDPEEGASLAMAVLDELLRRQTQGIVNTHLPPLKEYASGQEGLRNASMCFDSETLKPTYKLQIGESGKSFGLVIAEQNGLPTDLVNNARNYLLRIAGQRH
ncbi:endonuclease MutS2 [Acidihalobacter prosperus]